MNWLFIVTMFFADGHTERKPHEFFDVPHARDMCLAALGAELDELKQRTQRGLLKGYTVAVCHQPGAPGTKLPEALQDPPR